MSEYSEIADRREMLGGSLSDIDQARIHKLPKWAQRYIAELENRVKRAEATTPWTEPGMEWFTLLKDSAPQTIFLCDHNGTRPIAFIGANDRVFVGRAALEPEKQP